MVQITRVLSVVAAFSTLASALPTVQRRGQPVVVAAPAEHVTTIVQHPTTTVVAHPQVTTIVHQAPPAKHETSTVVAHPTVTVIHQTTPVHETTTSSAHVTVTAAPQQTHVTTSVAHPVSTVSYGSGSANWGNGSPEFNDCVQQCHAKFGAPAPSHTPSPTTVVAHGTGATHTVIVAPSQGVLRYVPFAVNATVGDTIKFVWGANNHTVTKGSALLPCNRSEEGTFATGIQNKDFVFHQVVNDTKPTYFFCGAPTHCQKGMFGIINPATNFDAATSVSRSMQSIAANNSEVAAYQTYTRAQTVKNAVASSWGGNIDLGALPDWAKPLAAENVLYTRNFLASNPETWKEDGIDLSTATTTPLSIPLDVKAALAAAGTSTTAPAATTPASTPSSSASPVSGLGTAEGLSNGAMGSASPRYLVAAAAVFATYFLL